MGDDFVAITSYGNVWEADWARSRLADEQIPAFLGNAGFVSWLWQYSNAVGGVIVYVARRDAEVACRLVTPEPAVPAESRPSWLCPNCKATVLGSWNVCWQCGRSTDGSDALRCAEDQAAVAPAVASERAYGTGVLAAVVTTALLLMLLRCDPLRILSILPSVVLFIIVLQMLGVETPTPSTPEGPEESERGRSDPSRPKHSRVAQAIVLRAWRAAIFGFANFSPLGLYSLWLMLRLPGRSIRLSWLDRLRCSIAVILDLCAILMLGLLLLALSASVTSFLLRYFTSAGGVP
jgi:hypothetical protein